jgi:nucleoporin NUP82
MYDPHHDSDASKHSSPHRSLQRGTVDQPYYGPYRLLARRGTEVFVVVGNQIRWTDLRMLKNDWEEQTYHSATWSKSVEHQEIGELASYRVR